MTAKEDFLDELMAEEVSQNPKFPSLVEAALKRRQLLRGLADERQAQGLSQTVVAARMKTSQSEIARIEGVDDTKLSTIDRYAAALGKKIDWRIVDAGRA